MDPLGIRWWTMERCWSLPPRGMVAVRMMVLVLLEVMLIPVDYLRR
jgi:hypothetical protein